jgi:hypothetical protein
MDLIVRRPHFSEEHLLKSKQTNPNSPPLFMQKETPLNKLLPRSHPIQTFRFPEYQSPVTFNIDPIPDPVKPVMALSLVTQTQVEKPKEYGMNKLTPFTGNQTKIR